MMDEKIEINQLKSTSEIDFTNEKIANLEIELPSIGDILNLEDVLMTPKLSNDVISTQNSVKSPPVVKNEVLNIDNISDYVTFFRYFEFAQYLSEVNTIEKINSYIEKVSCKRFNPFTKSIVVDEIDFLIDLDHPELSIDLPINILTNSFEKNSNDKFIFISLQYKKIVKIDYQFLFELVSGFSNVDKITFNNIKRLNQAIEDFKTNFDTDYHLILKIANGQESRSFWKEFGNSHISFNMRKYILEVWAFSKKWQLKYISKKYESYKLIKLMEEWKKKIKKRDEKNKRTIVPKILCVDSATDTSIVLSNDTKIVNSINNVLKNQEINLNENVSLDCGDIDSIQEINMDINEKTTNIEEINPNKVLEIYNLSEVSSHYECIAEFSKFVQDTEEFHFNVKDFNEKSFELDFYDENTTGDILLIDINDVESYNRFSLGINSIRNLFDMQGDNIFRVIFMDSKSNSVMEVKPNYLFQFMENFDPEMNAGRIDELLDCNRRAILINKYEKIPIVNVLSPFLTSIELIVNSINDFNFSEKISDEIVAVWQLNEDEEGKKIYQQIYPSNDEEKPDSDDIGDIGDAGDIGDVGDIGGI